ncbi:MAG: ATP synthase F0 subunit B [Candidatus Korobacteraceae bacterium]
MKRHLLSRLAVIVFFSLFLVAMLGAQDSSGQKAEPDNTAAESGGGGPNAGVGAILAKTTEQAAHTAEKWGHKLGIGPNTSFAISIAFNFAGIALVFYVLVKGKVPQAFRERTASIQRGIKEAQAASADAARRLRDIEARLAKLDTEVAEIRTSAEREAAAEEERIKQAAEEDKHKVVQAVETEIAAIARNARRELKGYAASLAVDLASRKIHVDEPTDHALVREFVDQLGKDGR